MIAALAVRLPNWLGDTVMAEPALAALRRAHAEARILLAGPWATVLGGQGLADTLVTYPRAFTGRLGAADVVRRFAPDTAVLLPNSFESGLAAWYWGAGRRIGFDTGGRGLVLTDALPRPEPRLHQIDEYRMLAERCEAPAERAEPRLTPPPADSAERAEARALLSDGAPGDGRPTVGVHLGAAYGSAKTWPAERVADLCRLLDEAGARAVLLGTANEAPAAAAIAARTSAVALAGRDRPALLPALLAELDALVSGDTGVAHLAAALGTPVVALFGPTDPALSAPRGPAVTLTHPVPCAPCFYRECPIDHPCLRDLAATRVRDAVRLVLQRRVDSPTVERRSPAKAFRRQIQ
ncbi:MAG TPA: glycosyltransferase family 9 protein [Methylomirabilota bacterium]|jgi:heptosyltransferase-2|nr:glycosyltransferase family 9 protein [Methylomirabilota bacterium]